MKVTHEALLKELQWEDTKHNIIVQNGWCYISVYCAKSAMLYSKTKIYQHLWNDNNGYSILLVCTTTSIFRFAFKNVQKQYQLFTLNIFLKNIKYSVLSKYNHTYQIFVIKHPALLCCLFFFFFLYLTPLFNSFVRSPPNHTVKTVSTTRTTD